MKLASDWSGSASSSKIIPPMSDLITLTPAQRAKILDLIHALADIALEGNEDVKMVDEMCERIDFVADMFQTK